MKEQSGSRPGLTGNSHMRFWSKVRVGKKDECWEWTASKDSGGYGRFGIGSKTLVGAHILSYVQYWGEVPKGKELDHLCRNRSCVNPHHLEPVTHKENMERGVQAQAKFCIRGHPYNKENTYYRPGGGRKCRACDRGYFRDRKSRKSR